MAERRPSVQHFMVRDGGDYAAGLGERGFGFADDTLVLPTGATTHLDALATCGPTTRCGTLLCQRGDQPRRGPLRDRQGRADRHAPCSWMRAPRRHLELRRPNLTADDLQQALDRSGSRLRTR